MDISPVLNFVEIIILFLLLMIGFLAKQKQNTDKGGKGCLVPTCSRKPYKYGVCKKHYKIYCQDDKVEFLLKYLFRIYNNKLSFWQRILLFFKSLLHWILNIDFKGYEHFPLENVFSIFYGKALKLLKVNKLNDSLEILYQLKIDFEHPENNLRFIVQEKIDEINLKLSKTSEPDIECEKYINKLFGITGKPVLMTFLFGIFILVTLYFFSLKNSVAGTVASKIFVEIRVILLFVYGILISFHFGLKAIRELPRIYDKFLNNEFGSNDEFNNKNLNLTLKMCSSMKRKEQRDFSGWPIFYYLFFLIVYVIFSISRSDIILVVYKSLALVFAEIVHYFIIRFLLVQVPIRYGINFYLKDLKIEINHKDCVGGLKPYVHFLFNTFLMGLSTYLLLVFLPFSLLNSNIETLPRTLISVFLIILFLTFAHPWYKSLTNFMEVHKQMVEFKKNTFEKIKFLKEKRTINTYTVRKLVILIESIRQFKTFPISINYAILSASKMLLGYIVISCFSPKYINFLKDVLIKFFTIVKYMI